MQRAVRKAALSAFRARYIPDAPTTDPAERDRALIHCLSQASLDR
jgi:hypothetical protein